MESEAHQALQTFAIDFRDGLIGTQPKSSRNMCALVSIPLRAALKVLRNIDTDLVTEDGHVFLVTADGSLRIDPTIDQFQQDNEAAEKVRIELHAGPAQKDQRLSDLPFIELLEQFRRLAATEGNTLGAKEAGALVAQYIYYPLAQRGFFEGRMV